MTLMKLENNRLSGISWSQKSKDCTTTLIQGPSCSQIHKGSRTLVTRDRGGEGEPGYWCRGRLTAICNSGGYGILFWL